MALKAEDPLHAAELEVAAVLALQAASPASSASRRSSCCCLSIYAMF